MAGTRPGKGSPEVTARLSRQKDAPSLAGHAPAGPRRRRRLCVLVAAESDAHLVLGPVTSACAKEPVPGESTLGGAGPTA